MKQEQSKRPDRRQDSRPGSTHLASGDTTRTGPEERVTGDHPELALEAGVITPDGELAIDGGKLPGRKDDFGDAVDETHGHAAPVPGASGANPTGS